MTIGITAYNAEDTIREALQSALEQTLPAHQIIVVDDCSTDTTMDVLAEYESYPNVEIHQNPQNGGVAVSRNVIVEHATGEFIVFFDDDDISAKDRAEAQVRRPRPQRVHHRGDFDARQVRAQAEVSARPEREVIAGVDSMGVIRVRVRRLVDGPPRRRETARGDRAGEDEEADR